MRNRTSLIFAVIGVALLTLVTLAEVVARTALEGRMGQTVQGGTVSFDGTSALYSLATGDLPVAITFDEDALAQRLGDGLGRAVDNVILSDGAIGVELAGGSGRLDAPITAWLALDAGPDGLEATVISVEVAGLQLQPRRLLGDDPVVPLGTGLGGGCAATTDITGVDVAPSGVTLHLTLTSETRACLTSQESS